MWIDASLSMMPPGLPGAGRVWRLIMFTPCTSTRASSRSTRSTSPLLPLSLPVLTTTLSPFRILNFTAIAAPDFPLARRLQHFRRQRDDLHEVLAAQLARHRPEDAGPDRLALLGDQHRRIAVEADRGTVRPPDLLGRPHDDRLMDVALLHAAARDRLLDRDDDDVADRGILALGAAEHLDALDAAGTRVVGDFQVGLHLDHGCDSLACSRLGVAQDRPALALGDRPALLNAHGLADLVHVR